MIKAACHCTAVRFVIAEPPAWVLDCNCTICRRYGALWAYYPGADQAKLRARPSPDVTAVYLWGDKDLAFHRCKSCGCVTHMEPVGVEPPVVYGVNARMMVGLDPAKVRLRRIDNGHSGFFWTRPDEPPIAGRHPPMPPAGPDEWR